MALSISHRPQCVFTRGSFCDRVALFCVWCVHCVCVWHFLLQKNLTPRIWCVRCVWDLSSKLFTLCICRVWCVCPVLICLTCLMCLMCLMCLTFSCVWCGFFLLHLKCLHFLSLKLSPSSSVFDVFNLCFGSFFLKNILHPVFDVFHVFQNFSQKFLTLFSCV